MRLVSLLTCLEYAVIQSAIPADELMITGISYDSRTTEKGNLFVCLRGYENDGHKYIQEAVGKGAEAVMIESLTGDGELLLLPRGTTVILVEDTREALAYLAAAWFRYPARKLSIIGVTGTKGKTTVSNLLKSVLEAKGKNCGYIGTIGVQIAKKSYPIKNTTPESFTIHQYFAKMVEAGCEYVVMEVSSQGMKYKRVEGICFEAAIFTNFGEDHIGQGEHESMEEYRHCKAMLFRQCKIGIGNVDDAEFPYMLANPPCVKYGFGLSKNRRMWVGRSDYPDSQQVLLAEGIRFVNGSGGPCTRFCAGNQEYALSLAGVFNVYNSLAVLQTLNALKLLDEMDEKQAGNIFLTGTVAGRMERVLAEKNIACYVDYAHNAMSLEQALNALRSYGPGRIITVFGCGGNRAKSRRTQMGNVSGSLSDLTIITSDNPRFESPAHIMEDIEEGVKETGGRYQMIEERSAAIRQALCLAVSGDIILVAGKGHEQYQEIEGVKFPMDDRILIEEAWKELGETECTQT